MSYISDIETLKPTTSFTLSYFFPVPFIFCISLEADRQTSNILRQLSNSPVFTFNSDFKEFKFYSTWWSGMKYLFIYLATELLESFPPNYWLFISSTSSFFSSFSSNKDKKSSPFWSSFVLGLCLILISSISTFLLDFISDKLSSALNKGVGDCLISFLYLFKLCGGLFD